MQPPEAGDSDMVEQVNENQHYCLRWNNYQTNMTSVFHQLLENEAFVDVTLACNDLSLKAHKVCIHFEHRCSLNIGHSESFQSFLKFKEAYQQS